MSLDLPSSIQELVGHKIKRLGTSYNNRRFFFDIPANRDNLNRARYGYEVVGGTIVGSYNLSPLLGGTVLEVYSTEPATNGYDQIVFRTNPTGTKQELTALYVSQGEGSLVFLVEEEDEEDFVETEDEEFFIILEEQSEGGTSIILDETINRDIFSPTDSDEEFFIIQENDFTYY